MVWRRGGSPPLPWNKSGVPPPAFVSNPGSPSHLDLGVLLLFFLRKIGDLPPSGWPFKEFKHSRATPPQPPKPSRNPPSFRFPFVPAFLRAAPSAACPAADRPLPGHAAVGDRAPLGAAGPPALLHFALPAVSTKPALAGPEAPASPVCAGGVPGRWGSAPPDVWF